ncbi:MAG TPA: 2-keto-4-pentenoate hydratase [Ktedonobacteraceae bacterium]|nr:2-keto-4-pentenoate hydratase [Ktedonobacteraceae bacterium]
MVELTVEGVASALHRAEQDRVPLAPLSETYPSLTPTQSYAIQSVWLDLKLKAGRHLIGRKIGLTSRAMQEQLGVDEPDYGFLLDSMWVNSGGMLASSEFILPRVEPEIAFWLSEDLIGPGVTVEQVLAATQGVCASLEIVDSRIENWRIKLTDTIADNASSARIVASQQVIPLQGLDLARIEVTLMRNGEPVGSGNGAAVLGNPATAVAWLANKLAEFGVRLQKGQVILPGAMCASVFAAPGDTFQAVFTQLGEVSVSFH